MNPGGGEPWVGQRQGCRGSRPAAALPGHYRAYLRITLISGISAARPSGSSCPATTPAYQGRRPPPDTPTLDAHTRDSPQLRRRPAHSLSGAPPLTSLLCSTHVKS